MKGCLYLVFSCVALVALAGVLTNVGDGGWINPLVAGAFMLVLVFVGIKGAMLQYKAAKEERTEIAQEEGPEVVRSSGWAKVGLGLVIVVGCFALALLVGVLEWDQIARW